MLSDEVIHDEHGEHDKQNACHLAKPYEHLVDGRLPFLHLYLDGIGYGVVHGHGVGLGVVDVFEPILVSCLCRKDGVPMNEYTHAVMQVDAIHFEKAIRLAYVPIPVLCDWNVSHTPASCQRHEHHGQHSEREPL